MLLTIMLPGRRRSSRIHPLREAGGWGPSADHRAEVPGGRRLLFFFSSSSSAPSPRRSTKPANIDGAGPFRLFFSVILPLLTPAIATTAIFTFIFTWNDFFLQLLYLGNSVSSYTVPVALRAFIDATSQSSWPQTLAMSTLSLIPILALFMVFQRLLVEGISTTGLRG